MRGRGWYVRTLLAAMLLFTAVDAIRPMLSYRALELGASVSQLGFIAASNGIIALVIAIPVGRWVDRLGEPRFILAGGMLVTATGVWLTTVSSIIGLGVAQALLGASLVLGRVGIQTLVANGGPAATRDGRFGIFYVFVSLSQVAGPALGAVVVGTLGAPLSRVFGIAAACAVGTALLAVSLWRWPSPFHERSADRSPPPREAMLPTLRVVTSLPGMRQAMLASVAVLVSVDLLIAYLPAYGEARGISVEMIGLLLSVRAGAAMASRVLMLPLIRWLGRQRVLVASMLLPAVAVLVLPLTTSTVLLVAILVVIGFGLGVGQPLTLAWVAGAAPAELRGTALSVRITGNGLGQFMLPAIAGAIAGLTGLAAIFVTIGAMLAGSGTAVLRGSFEHTKASDGPAPTDQRPAGGSPRS